MGITANHLIELFQQIADAMGREKEYLTELDGAIGDSDHGITMKLGFDEASRAVTQLKTSSPSPSEVLEAAASAFLDAVGASTGPLYATAFKSASQALQGVQILTTNDQVNLLEAIVSGIQKRGRATRGEKTMLDAWIPAVEAAHLALENNLSTAQMWETVASAGEAGAQDTATMTATKGRAARLGERSLGHKDPGAESAAIILRTMANCFAQK